MRTRWRASILAVITIGLIALLWFLAHRSAAKPAISIGVLSYGSPAMPGPYVPVRLGITNRSRIAIRLTVSVLGSPAMLRVERQKGWEDTRLFGGYWLGNALLVPSSNTAHPLANGLVMSSASTFSFIQPGSKSDTSVLLPPDTQRWQIAYRVQSPSLRDLVLSRIPANWRGRFRPLCERLFSGVEGPVETIASEVFEMPYVLRPSDHEAPPLKEFNPLSPAPAAW